MKAFRVGYLVIAATLAGGLSPVFAQIRSPQAPSAPRPPQVQGVPAPPQPGAVVLYQGQTNAREVQSQLREDLRQFLRRGRVELVGRQGHGFRGSALTQQFGGVESFKRVHWRLLSGYGMHTLPEKRTGENVTARRLRRQT
jgi:hypothetical protein